jgi:hypothetical protein
MSRVSQLGVFHALKGSCHCSSNGNKFAQLGDRPIYDPAPKEMGG